MMTTWTTASHCQNVISWKHSTPTTRRLHQQRGFNALRACQQRQTWVRVEYSLYTRLDMLYTCSCSGRSVYKIALLSMDGRSLSEERRFSSCLMRCGVVSVQKRGVAVLGSNRSLSIITDCRLHCMAAEANCTEMGDFTGYCLHLVFMLLGFYQELWNHRRHVLDRWWQRDG